MFRKILIPVDTAEPDLSEPGISFAAKLVAMTNGSVRLIYVFPEIPSVLQELLAPHAVAEQEAAADKRLQDMAKRSELPAGHFSHTLRTGAVYAEVLAEAQDWAADLIIVGSHSPSMSTYLLGSNAQKIVRHADCSVLVVRPHMQEEGVYSLVPSFA
jgi:nucleotide-binding universal stress UspA family protein